MIKKIFVDVLLLEFHFFFTSKSVEQYFVKPKMKSSFQWDYPRIMKFRFSVYCKVRVIDFPNWPETLSLYSFKFAISDGLVVQFCYRKGARTAERKNQVN